MKKNVILLVSAAMLLSSCGTYTASGAYTGSSLGSILGSAIGGISGGPRGSDIGTIVGMAGGAIIGGAIGQQADKQRQEDLSQYSRDKAERAARRQAQAGVGQQQYGSASQQQYSGTGSYARGNSGDDGAVFDSTNSGDDRLYDFSSSDYTGNYSAQQPTTTLPATSSVEELAANMEYAPHIEIRNARIVDSNQDRVISRGELCKVIFEVYNTGQKPLYDIQPSVIEATGNKQIFISPGMHVEQLLPGAGIRYTAMLKAGPRLGDGSIRLCLSVLQGSDAISKVTEFTVPTTKKKATSK